MGDISLHIFGAEDAAALGEHIIEQSGRLDNYFADALREAHVGVSEVARVSALERLPNRNGLAEAVAAAHISVDVSNGAGGPSVTITASHQYDLQGLDDGLNIHPLFGNRRHWYLQRVHPGWFTTPITHYENAVTQAFLEAAARRFADTLE
jgi:hypothetical protein